MKKIFGKHFKKPVDAGQTSDTDLKAISGRSIVSQDSQVSTQNFEAEVQTLEPTSEQNFKFGVPLAYDDEEGIEGGQHAVMGSLIEPYDQTSPVMDHSPIPLGNTDTFCAQDQRKGVLSPNPVAGAEGRAKQVTPPTTQDKDHSHLLQRAVDKIHEDSRAQPALHGIVGEVMRTSSLNPHVTNPPLKVTSLRKSASDLVHIQGHTAILFDQQEERKREVLLESEAEALKALEEEAERKREKAHLIEGELSSHPQAGKLEDLKIESIIEELKNGDPGQKKLAAHQLRMLAKFSDENRGLIGDAGGIRPLANLAASGDQEAAAEAVTALLNLSIHDENKRIMPAHGVVQPLVEVMRDGKSETKENAAAALFSLSLIDDNKIIIGASGAIPPLTQILVHGTDQGQRDACKALFNLSILGTNKSRIVEAGAVPKLVSYLQEPGSGMAEKAMSVLANLATSNEGREAIASEDEGIPGLVEVVEAGTHRGKENAAAALWQLARHSDVHRQLILEEVVIPPLVALTQTGTPRAREKAGLLLKDFRENRDQTRG